jgi:murein DD-endopeptidase MepM/ murein hydrolase activator NlpD
MVWPVRGTIASTFGSKGGGIANDGIDIRAAAGAPVVAVDNGIVAYAGNELKALGNLVLIQHAGNWVSAYANTGSLTVQKGQTVTRGQQVATTGQSGNAKFVGLHFELRRGTEAVDPLQHLPRVGNGELAAR